MGGTDPRWMSRSTAEAMLDGALKGFLDGYDPVIWLFERFLRAGHQWEDKSLIPCPCFSFSSM